MAFSGIGISAFRWTQRSFRVIRIAPGGKPRELRDPLARIGQITLFLIRGLLVRGPLLEREEPKGKEV